MPKKEKTQPVLISVGIVISMKGEFRPFSLILQKAMHLSGKQPVLSIKKVAKRLYKAVNYLAFSSL